VFFPVTFPAKNDAMTGKHGETMGNLSKRKVSPRCFCCVDPALRGCHNFQP
jgi:hypothetical protein